MSDEFITMRLIPVGASAKGKVSDKIRKSLANSVRKHAIAIQTHIRMSMLAPKHGREYTYKGKRYTASAPGEPPAVRSGALYRAIIPLYASNGMSARIAPRVKGASPYPSFLEHGTSRMDPRPYLKPAFDIYRKAFLFDVKKIVSNAISGT